MELRCLHPKITIQLLPDLGLTLNSMSPLSFDLRLPGVVHLCKAKYLECLRLTGVRNDIFFQGP